MPVTFLIMERFSVSYAKTCPAVAQSEVLTLQTFEAQELPITVKATPFTLISKADQPTRHLIIVKEFSAMRSVKSC